MVKDSLFHYDYKLKNFILLSIFFNKCFYFERVIFIYYSYSRIKYSLCKLYVFISNTHFLSIYCKGKSSLKIFYYYDKYSKYWEIIIYEVYLETSWESNIIPTVSSALMTLPYLGPLLLLLCLSSPLYMAQP